MGKTNRFRRLKELGQMTAKVKQQRYDEGLLGDGVCAALSMQWLQRNGKLDASAIDKSIKGIAEIQRTFESIVKTEGTIKAVEVLARAMGLRFVAPPSYCLPNQQPSQFWSDQGYGTNFSNQIVAFARTLHAGLEPDSMQAAFLSVKLVIVSLTIFPGRYCLSVPLPKNSPRSLP